jgi:hypothetical protein
LRKRGVLREWLMGIKKNPFASEKGVEDEEDE